MDLDSTIVAVSSSRGISSHALIRATGSKLFDCVETIGLTLKPRELTGCKITLPQGQLPVIGMAFQAASSYSGQDTIEIILVNNEYLINSLVQTLIKLSSGRHAEAGEFTARAFLNGKIGLSQAEGVCATIAANNDAELRGAAMLRSGALSIVTEPIASEITRVLSLVEAGIDFTDEEDVVAVSVSNLKEIIEQCLCQVKEILTNKISMETLRNLPYVVLAGLPNAGKSSLFNALLGTKRTVISNLSGTTRDAIAEPVCICEKEVLLIDIAGCDDVTSNLTASVQQTSLQTIDRADVLLWCVAPGQKVANKPNNAIVVHTMGDLDSSHPKAISANNGKGIIELKKQIAQLIEQSPTEHRDAPVLLPRHEESLHTTSILLEEALLNVHTAELVSASLREALNKIGSITGRVTPDEIIGKVFSTFCIGK
jgi:tRNA modification GTPase